VSWTPLRFRYPVEAVESPADFLVASGQDILERLDAVVPLLLPNLVGAGYFLEAYVLENVPSVECAGGTHQKKQPAASDVVVLASCF
jgi:hypothetical protein